MAVPGGNELVTTVVTERGHSQGQCLGKSRYNPKNERKTQTMHNKTTESRGVTGRRNNTEAGGAALPADEREPT